MTASRRSHKSKRSGDRLGAADWLRAARKELIAHGILAVKVDRLRSRLRVTRGSFYWHFKSRQHLLGELLKSWVASNTTPFKRVLESEKKGEEKFQAIVDLWLAEDEYDPRFDTAVREWARVSSQVARVVNQADTERIAVFERIFQEIGYRGTDAHVRARIAYYHQVGYYALGVIESQAARRKLRPYYTRALLGSRRLSLRTANGTRTQRHSAREPQRLALDIQTQRANVHRHVVRMP